MKDWIKEVYMYVLGAMVIIGFFAVVIYKLYMAQDVQLEIGALIAAFAMIVGYFYGSSKGSADKTKIIANGNKPA